MKGIMVFTVAFLAIFTCSLPELRITVRLVGILPVTENANAQKIVHKEQLLTCEVCSLIGSTKQSAAATKVTANTACFTKIKKFIHI